MATRRLSARPWGRIRVAILERDGYRYALCGRSATTVDHIVPRSKGGTDDDWNLRAACGPCNFGRRDRPIRVRATPLRRAKDCLPRTGRAGVVAGFLQSPSTCRTTSRLTSRFGVRSKVGRKVTDEHCRARQALPD
jgi:HNH endonuclease